MITIAIFVLIIVLYLYLLYPRSLNDFENSCAAYDKALELGEDYLTHLNYCITLFSNDEIERAREQFLKFESLFVHVNTTDIDTDILTQADLLRKVF